MTTGKRDIVQIMRECAEARPESNMQLWGKSRDYLRHILRQCGENPDDYDIEPSIHGGYAISLEPVTWHEQDLLEGGTP